MLLALLFTGRHRQGWRSDTFTGRESESAGRWAGDFNRELCEIGQTARVIDTGRCEMGMGVFVIEEVVVKERGRKSARQG